MNRMPEESLVSRRTLLKVCAGTWWLSAPVLRAWASEARPSQPLIAAKIILEHDDGQFLWFHPRACAIPGPDPAKPPRILMTIQKHLRVSDYYSGLWYMTTRGVLVVVKR
ncbi:MAG TPA: hypothetical protein PKX28_01950, partial [Candidatus Hydrogenedentes bacterium]|nr:hypothetical protein [Candidatus Hydrogenedentota bacterium]